MNALPPFHLVASPWVAALLTHLWQSTAVALAILLLLIIGRRLSARTRRTLGWIAVSKFALPTAWVVALLPNVAATYQSWPLMDPVLPSAGLTATTTMVAAPVQAWVPPAWLWPLLGSVWAVVAVGLIARWLSRGVRVRRMLLAKAGPLTEAVTREVAAAAARAGLRVAPRCVEVDRDHGPGALGITSPVLILPRGLMQELSPAERAAILIHECVHVRRRDNLWSAVRAGWVGMLWFNPIAWLVNRAIGIETEKSCDERVLEITGDADNYASGIVAAVRHTLGVMQPGFAAATTPPVVARLKNILAYPAQPDSPALRWTAVAVALALVALGGRAGSIAATAPTAAVQQTPEATRASEALPVGERESNRAVARDFLWTQSERLKGEAAAAQQKLDDFLVAGSTEADAEIIRKTLELEAATKAQQHAELLKRLHQVEKMQSMRSRGTVRVAQATSAPLAAQPAKPAYKIGTIRINTVGVRVPPPASQPDRVITNQNILSHLQSREGGEFNEKTLDRDIRALYALGSFKTVEVKHERVDGETFNLVFELTLMQTPTEGSLSRPPTDPTRANVGSGRLVLGPTPPPNAGTETLRSVNPGTLTLSSEPGPSSGVTFELPARTKFPAPSAAPGATPAGDEELRAAQAQLAAESQELKRMRDEREAAVIRQKRAQEEQAQREAFAREQRAVVSGGPPPTESELAAARQKIADANARLAQLRAEREAALARQRAANPTPITFDGPVFEPKDLDRAPVVQFQARPQYPFEMRRAGIEGEVVVDFIVDVDGRVQLAQAIRSSRREFEAAAVLAVSKWKFLPGQKNGKSVPTHMQMPIVFTLEKR